MSYLEGDSLLKEIEKSFDIDPLAVNASTETDGAVNVEAIEADGRGSSNSRSHSRSKKSDARKSSQTRPSSETTYASSANLRKRKRNLHQQ